MEATAYVWDGTEFHALPLPITATVMYTEAKIDSLRLSVVQSAVAASLLSSNPSAAAYAVIKHAGYLITFHGYLDMATPTFIKGAAADNIVNLLGVTHVLRTSTARSWANTLPTDIAMDVLRPYRLGLEMDSAPAQQFVSQAEGESDWAFLGRLAQSLGFALSSNDGIIRVLDLRKEIRRTPNRTYQTLALPTGDKWSNVSRFQVLSTTTPSGIDYRDTTMMGVDALGVQFTYRTSFEPNTNRIDPEFAVLSTGTYACLQDAIIEAKRINSQARFTSTAKAEIVGYLPIEAGRFVWIRDQTGTYSGWWYCTDVRYEFDTRIASTYVTLGRGQSEGGGNIDVPPSRVPIVQMRHSRWQIDRDWTKVL